MRPLHLLEKSNGVTRWAFVRGHMSSSHLPSTTTTRPRACGKLRPQKAAAPLSSDPALLVLMDHGSKCAFKV
jgi:hypothetical protein